MIKKASCLIIFLLMVVMVGCGEKPQPTATKPKADTDPKRAKFQEAIDKTTPEGKDMVEKVKAMKPLVNDKVAAKTLGEITDDFASKNGEYNTKPIGWAASQKGTTKNWKIVYYYQDYQGQYNTAEWEYNPDSKQLYPFEFTNAPTFYTDITAAGATNSNTKNSGTAPDKNKK
jgi:hypothetical protein